MEETFKHIDDLTVKLKKVIDWEQRRYELAKTLFSKLPIYTSKNEIKYAIKQIVEFTDLFINELKNKKDETDNRN